MRRLAVVAAFATLALAPTAHAWTWPASGEVLEPFVYGGDPYAGGQHRGIDVAGEREETVLAPALGRRHVRRHRRRERKGRDGGDARRPCGDARPPRLDRGEEGRRRPGGRCRGIDRAERHSRARGAVRSPRHPRRERSERVRRPTRIPTAARFACATAATAACPLTAAGSRPAPAPQPAPPPPVHHAPPVEPPPAPVAEEPAETTSPAEASEAPTEVPVAAPELAMPVEATAAESAPTAPRVAADRAAPVRPTDASRTGRASLAGSERRRRAPRPRPTHRRSLTPVVVPHVTPTVGAPAVHPAQVAGRNLRDTLVAAAPAQPVQVVAPGRADGRDAERGFPWVVALLVAGAIVAAIAVRLLRAGLPRAAPKLMTSALLPDDADLLREREPAHRARVHDHRRRHPRPASPATGRRRVLADGTRRARDKGLPRRTGAGSGPAGLRRPNRRGLAGVAGARGC